MSTTQLADGAFAIASNAPLPLPAKLAVASLDTNNQQAARKAENYALATIFGVGATIALLISIGLFVSVFKSTDTTLTSDGRWYGGWSVLILAALPLFWLMGYTLHKNAQCHGDIVGSVANLAPGKLGRAAQAYQRL